MMAPIPGPDRLRYSSGLWRELADREIRCAATPGGILTNREAETSYSGTAERLAAAKTGNPISMPVSDLPAHARIGLNTRWNHRATVAVNGSICLSLDSAAHWLAEQGL